MWIVRIAFFLLCSLGGLGFLLYLAGWLLIPAEGETDTILQGWLNSGQARRWVGVLLVGIAVIALASEVRLIRGELAFALVVIAIGVMLYRGDLSSADRRPSAGRSSGQGEAPDPGGEAAGPRVSPSVQAPKPRRERSFLGRISVGFAVLAVGLLGLLDSVLEGFHPEFRHYVALFTAVVGLGLVIGAWFGRYGGLVALGFVLVPVLVLSPVLPPLAVLGEHGWSARSRHEQVELKAWPVYDRYVYRISEPSELPDGFSLEQGALRLDLSELTLGDDRNVAVSVARGVVWLTVPDQPSFRVTTYVDRGRIYFFDQEERKGSNLFATRSEQSVGTPRLGIDIRVGEGTVMVEER